MKPSIAKRSIVKSTLLRSRQNHWSSLIPWELLIAPITELVRTLVENLFAAFVGSRATAQAGAQASNASTPDSPWAGSHARYAGSSSAGESPLDDPLVEQATEA